jgi:23S rRNA A2030 N6-methylase RlmJ
LHPVHTNRYIVAQDPGYARTKELVDTLEAVSRLLARYPSAILTSAS